MAVPQADQPSRCRRYQFQLRTLMIAVTLFCVIGAWLGNQVRAVIERKAILSNEPVDAVTIDDSARARLFPRRGDIAWIRRLLGDRDCFAIFADQSATDRDLERYQSAFPEAEVRRRQ
jgi:hypothetical protein